MMILILMLILDNQHHFYKMLWLLKWLQRIIIKMNMEPNNDMNKLVCLGDIKHKLIVSLDVDHILHDTRQ